MLHNKRVLKKNKRINFHCYWNVKQGFNITKSCVQNDFHQNWEFKFKFNINKLEKGIQIRLIAS